MNTVHLTTSAKVAPASSKIALTFINDNLVSSFISDPLYSSPVAILIGSCPETYIVFPAFIP